MLTTERSIELAALPVEILYQIGLQLLPKEPPSFSPFQTSRKEWPERISALRNLAFTCRRIYHGLGSLLRRFVVLRNGCDMLRIFILLVDHPEYRSQVRHIQCDTFSDSEINPDRLSLLWSQRFGENRRLEEVMTDAGLPFGPGRVQRITKHQRLDPKFHSEDALMFVFGCTLLVTVNLETLAVNDCISGRGCVEIVTGVLTQSFECHPVLGKLRALQIGALYLHKYPTRIVKDLLYFSCMCTLPIQTLEVGGMNADFLEVTDTLSVQFGATMPHVQELRIRPWVTPRALKHMPIHDVPLLQQLPVFFPCLRVLEVLFRRAPHDAQNLWVVAEAWADTLEVLKLRNQSFPRELMQGAAMKRLRHLSVKLCPDVPPVPDLDNVASILATGEEAGCFKHRVLERLDLNERSFDIKVEAAGLPKVSLWVD